MSTDRARPSAHSHCCVPHSTGSTTELVPDRGTGRQSLQLQHRPPHTVTSATAAWPEGRSSYMVKVLPVWVGGRQCCAMHSVCAAEPTTAASREGRTRLLTHHPRTDEHDTPLVIAAVSSSTATTTLAAFAPAATATTLAASHCCYYCHLHFLYRYHHLPLSLVPPL